MEHLEPFQHLQVPSGIPAKKIYPCGFLAAAEDSGGRQDEITSFSANVDAQAYAPWLEALSFISQDRTEVLKEMPCYFWYWISQMHSKVWEIRSIWVNADGKVVHLLLTRRPRNLL